MTELQFHADDDCDGVTIVDPVEGRRFPLETTSPVTPTTVDSDSIGVPVDEAVTIETETVGLPYVVVVYVRDENFEMVTECAAFDEVSVPDGSWIVEFSGPVKCYLRVDGPLTVRATGDDMAIDFGEPTCAILGVRSHHDRPRTTVTTTTDPDDLMAAVSTFGSALKTMSPERSFPTLRGHPPKVELGDRLDVPAAAEPPDTGLQIEVPRDVGSIYATATLVHYLGATVVPGSEPRLLAHGEPIRTFDDEIDIAIDRVLRQLLLLDCVVRSDGLYQIELYEARAARSRLDLPFEALYDAPIADRVRRYLSVPFEEIKDLLPRWGLSAHVDPTPERVELLPYVVNALGTIRVERDPVETPPPPPPAIEAFVREAGRGPTRIDPPQNERYVEPHATDAIEQVWIGPGRPMGANAISKRAFENRWRTEHDEDVDITLVCNDAEMAAELVAEDRYGDRDELPFEVVIERELSVEELRRTLAGRTDFLHYVGHVEENGFVCRDGVLDAETVAETGVSTFLLNGCRSYDQGLALVDAGAIGGIVTHGAVTNERATELGKLVAGLLNAGFTLRSALALARSHGTAGSHYAVVGDGSVQVAQCESGTAVCYLIDRVDAGYVVRLLTYPTGEMGMGTAYVPFGIGQDEHYLIGGELPPVTLSLPELLHQLHLERLPAVIDGELVWSTDVTSSIL